MMTAFLLLALLTERPDPSDLIRFPPREVAERCLHEAFEAETIFRARWELASPYTAEWYHWGAAITATHRHYLVWDCLVDAHRDCCDGRAKLRRILTPLEYRTGKMPNPIPAWAVTE